MSYQKIIYSLYFYFGINAVRIFIHDRFTRVFDHDPVLVKFFHHGFRDIFDPFHKSGFFKWELGVIDKPDGYGLFVLACKDDPAWSDLCAQPGAVHGVQVLLSFGERPDHFLQWYALLRICNIPAYCKGGLHGCCFNGSHILALSLKC